MKYTPIRIIFVILCFIFFNVPAAKAAQNSSPAVQADGAKKIDQIIKNQEQILKQLEEMKKELTIVKYRCSNN